MITIGISDTTSAYDNYPAWILTYDSNIQIIKLTSENFYDLKKCDGVILSGGIDSHPKYYHNSRLDYPNAPAVFNEQRDEFETAIFKYTQQFQIPLLAICRGMQLINIILGGTLLQDLEESKKLNHRRINNEDGMHDVKVVPNTLLYEIIKNSQGTLNSAHHQGLDKIANDLKVNAWSPDMVAEGVEWKNKNGKSFFLAVQWHPERLILPDAENPMSKNIRNAFLNALKNK